MRSWRYMAVINDGVSENWFEETGLNNEDDDDTYVESTTEYVVDYLNCK